MLSRRDFLRLSCIASISLAAPESFGEILHKFDNEPEVKDSLFFNKDYFRKIKEFDRSFPDDYMATPEEFVLIRSVSAKIRSVMNHVGYVNFNVINYDDLLRSMKQYSSLRRFDQKELDYIEEIFARDAADYGFFGEKVMTSLTDNIRRNDIVRIPRTGHYIYKDAVSTHAYALWAAMCFW